LSTPTAFLLMPLNSHYEVYSFSHILKLFFVHRSMILLIAFDQFTLVLALVKGGVFSDKFINSNDNFSSRHNFSSFGWISAL
jgi:hypothetical protein